MRITIVVSRLFQSEVIYLTSTEASHLDIMSQYDNDLSSAYFEQPCLTVAWLARQDGSVLCRMVGWLVAVLVISHQQAVSLSANDIVIHNAFALHFHFSLRLSLPTTLSPTTLSSPTARRLESDLGIVQGSNIMKLFKII